VARFTLVLEAPLIRGLADPLTVAPGDLVIQVPEDPAILAPVVTVDVVQRFAGSIVDKSCGALFADTG
jgi:hypothetical protein